MDFNPEPGNPPGRVGKASGLIKTESSIIMIEQGKDARKMKLKETVRRFAAGKTHYRFLFLITVIFQIFVITRFKPLYYVIFGLFLLLIARGILAISKAGKSTRIAVLGCLLFLIVMRLPFYIHPSGLMLTSDNALEAIQCREIVDNKTAPFFLLDVAKHMGTLFYLFGAYIWEIFGVHYLSYILLRLVMFSALLFLLYRTFKDSFDPKSLALLLVLNFAFVETVFDTSLSLRGGTYLEMLIYLFLGFAVFDFSFKDKFRIFLSFYFAAFAVYFHPLAAVFIVAFVFAAAARALFLKKLLPLILLFAGGTAAGLFHWFYYLLFIPPPIRLGNSSIESIKIIPLSKLSFGWLLTFFPKFTTIFRNIFRFELSYMVDAVKAPSSLRSIALGLNEAVIVVSFIALITGTALAMKKIIRILMKKDSFEAGDWIAFFHIGLLAAAAGKILGVNPPLTEPRHNFDWIVLIILSYLMTATAFLKIKKWISMKTAVVAILVLAFTFPHYYYFLKLVEHKEASYTDLLKVLDKNNVRYLTTDFIYAYPIYFFSDRKIMVSDSLGPFRIREMMYDMKLIVDAVPKDGKAYLFESKDYPSSNRRKAATIQLKIKLFRELKAGKIPYKTVQLEDYTLVIPTGAARQD